MGSKGTGGGGEATERLDTVIPAVRGWGEWEVRESIDNDQRDRHDDGCRRCGDNGGARVVVIDRVPVLSVDLPLPGIACVWTWLDRVAEDTRRRDLWQRHSTTRQRRAR